MDDNSTRSLTIPIDPNTAFESISNSRRRRLSLSLSRTTGPTTARDLVVEFAAIENGIDPSKISKTDRTSVYIALTQTHLEMLDDAGAVEYDGRWKMVAPTDVTEPLAEYLRQLQTACYKPDTEANT